MRASFILASLLLSAVLAAPRAARGAAQAAEARRETTAPAQEPQPAEELPLLGVNDARTSVSRAVRYLLEKQHPDGSWGSGAADSVQWLLFSVETFKAFQVGANSLAFLALLSVEDNPERRAALERALEWLIQSRIPRRGNDWDIDCSWSGLYGFQAMVAAASDPRFQGERWTERVRERGLDFYALLEKNQEPLGGWGYYEGPAISRRPTWSTSFATACVVPSLVRAQELGWRVDPKVLARAVRYIERCRLPTGAYTYDLSAVPWVAGESINNVKGSLGRMQVCNWALSRAGSSAASADGIRKGLIQFFEDHKFLDVARMRPIPHEAYYANAAYFYLFGHCYAGQVINQLPEAERDAWHDQLRAHLVKIQWDDGSSLDFPNMSSMQIAGTSFSILALQAGIPGARLSL